VLFSSASAKDREQQGVFASYCPTKLRSQLAHDLTASTLAFGMHQRSREAEKGALYEARICCTPFLQGAKGRTGLG